MHLHIERRPNNVFVRGSSPTDGAELFGWVAIPAGIISLLPWQDEQGTTDEKWFCELGQLLDDARLWPSEEAEARAIWSTVIYTTAQLVMLGMADEAKDVLNTYKTMRKQNVVLELEGSGALNFVRHDEASQKARSPEHQRELFADALESAELRQKMFTARITPLSR